jgi:DNA polymerase I-like protein with 3'-5' exonuclease and polymerase domains
MIYFIGNNAILPGLLHYQLATIDDVVSYCIDKTVLGVDTETEGLDFTCKKMIMFQIGDQDNQYVIDTRDISIEPLRDILEHRDIVKIFHNAKFDYKFIKKWSDITCQGVYDTFLVELVNNCGKNLGYSLKDLCKRYFNVELNKDVRDKFVNLNGKPFDDNQIVYGAKDVAYLCKIRKLQLPITERYRLQNVVKLENDVVLAFADIEYNGLDLNKEEWSSIESESIRDAEILMINLDQMIIENSSLNKFVCEYVQTDMFTPVNELRKVSIKWTSPKQVLKVFQTIIPKLENVNGKEIYKYKFKFPIVNEYIKYKEAMKLYTSYGDKFLKNLSNDNKIHTNFHQILDTGRVSSSKPNMQQIPADNKFRNCFTAPSGWKFVSADYSSQELNVIAFGSKDPVWIEALKKGEDLHSTCAELVYGEKWLNSAEDNCNYLLAKGKCNCPKHKKLRTNVKTINFGLAYGMGPNKLANTLDISIVNAKILIDKYFKAFPAIKGFLEKLGNFGKKFGYIKTFPPYNRKRWFTNWYPKIWAHKSSFMELGSIERASKNTPIQGASADMTKRALILMREHIKEFDIPVKLVMTVHDQIDTICKDDYVCHWKHDMRSIMEDAALEIVTNGLLKAEVTVNNCWTK